MRFVIFVLQRRELHIQTHAGCLNAATMPCPLFCLWEQSNQSVALKLQKFGMFDPFCSKSRFKGQPLWLPAGFNDIQWELLNLFHNTDVAAVTGQVYSCHCTLRD
eukprot:s1402_g13.t1